MLRYSEHVSDKRALLCRNVASSGYTSHKVKFITVTYILDNATTYKDDIQISIS